MGWAGMTQLGGQTPATQTYPQAQQVASGLYNWAGADTNLPGTYGWWGEGALQSALQGSQAYGQAFGTPSYSPLTTANQQMAAGQGYLPSLLQAYQNPAIQDVVNQVLGTTTGPAAQQAQAAAQQGVGLVNQGVTAAQPGISALGNLAGIVPGAASGAANLALSNLPTSQQMAQLGAQGAQTPANIPQSQQLAALGGGLAPQYAQQLQQAYAPLQAASNQILQTGFDPQNALFNQTANQALQQQNAINAMSGVGTSPYGAGVTGQAMQNFDLNWQNQQLARQSQAAQIANQLAQTLPGFQQQAMANLANAQQMQAGPTALAGQQLQNLFNAQQMQAAPAQLGMQALNALTQGGQAAQQLYGGALGLGTQAGQAVSQAGLLPAQIQTQLAQNALSALTGQANIAGQGAGALGTLAGATGTMGQNQLAAINALAQTGQLPYQISTQQAQNALGALGQQQQLGQGLLNLPQQVVQDLLPYMQLGQAASALSGQLGNLGANQLGTGLGGIAQGLGALGGSNLLFGQGGLSGALNLGNQGLLGGALGSLFGTGAGAGFTGGTAAALSSGTSALDALAPALLLA